MKEISGISSPDIAYCGPLRPGYEFTLRRRSTMLERMLPIKSEIEVTVNYDTGRLFGENESSHVVKVRAKDLDEGIPVRIASDASSLMISPPDKGIDPNRATDSIITVTAYIANLTHPGLGSAVRLADLAIRGPRPRTILGLVEGASHLVREK